MLRLFLPRSQSASSPAGYQKARQWYTCDSPATALWKKTLAWRQVPGISLPECQTNLIPGLLSCLLSKYCNGAQLDKWMKQDSGKAHEQLRKPPHSRHAWFWHTFFLTCKTASCSVLLNTVPINYQSLHLDSHNWLVPENTRVPHLNGNSSYGTIHMTTHTPPLKNLWTCIPATRPQWMLPESLKNPWTEWTCVHEHVCP